MTVRAGRAGPCPLPAPSRNGGDALEQPGSRPGGPSRGLREPIGTDRPPPDPKPSRRFGQAEREVTRQPLPSSRYRYGECRACIRQADAEGSSAKVLTEIPRVVGRDEEVYEEGCARSALQ